MFDDDTLMQSVLDELPPKIKRQIELDKDTGIRYRYAVGLPFYAESESRMWDRLVPGYRRW
jgi:hypothetical protein